MNTRNGSTTTAETGLDNLKDSVKNLVEQGQERAAQLKDRAIDVKDQAMSRGSDFLDTATTAIKANPLKSVAIAFGVGYIGMRLFR